PWALYLPALVLLLWPRPRRIQSEAITYALCWFVAIFGFFSISRGKCEIYILPALPPLALLLGWTVAQTDRNEPVRRGFLPLFSAASLVTALGAFAMVAGATLVLIHGPVTPPIKLHPTDRRFLEIFSDIAAQHDYRLLNWMVLSGLGGLVIVWGIVRGRTPLQPFGVLLIAVAGG